MFAFVLSLLALSPEAPFHDVDFDTALARANAEDKVVMIDFFTTWCGPCKKLDATTWTDAKVVEWLGENTIALKLDAEVETELAQRFEVTAYPTMVFVGADGDAVARMVGYVDAAGFLELAPRRLAGVTKLDEVRAQLEKTPDDAMVRMNLGRELAAAGEHAQALREFLVCFDTGRESVGYGGVRLSYLLADIARLGEVHPPALEALRARADAAERALLEGEGGLEEAMDLAALNERLGRSEATLALWDELRSREEAGDEPRAPQTLKALYRQIVDLLMKEERYADVIAGAGDVMQVIEGRIRMYEDTRIRFEGSEHSPADYMRDLAVSDATTYFQAYLGAGDPEGATRVADRVLEFDARADTFLGLARAARRMEAVDVAREILRRGFESLPEEEHDSLRREERRVDRS